MSKLTLLHINIIGAVVAIIVGIGLYFTIITGAQDEQKKAQSDYDGVKARADKATVAAANLKKAKADQVSAIKDYALFEAKYTPTIGYRKNRLDTMIDDFWPNKGKSWPERFRKTMQTYMRTESKRNKIVWENPGVIDLPSYGPNPNSIDAGGVPGEGYGAGAVPTLHYRFPMQVAGRDMNSLLRHIEGWNNIGIAGVPVVDAVQIVGNSPNLTMTYTLTLTIILKDGEKIPEPDPRIGGESGQAGGGGGGGFSSGGGGMGSPMATGMSSGGGGRPGAMGMSSGGGKMGMMGMSGVGK